MGKRVLCIGDSLGLPREGVLYEDTWIFKLKEFFSDYDFIDKFQRAVTTDILISDNKSDYFEYYKPDIIILQLGIVDCAPRLLRRRGLLYRIITNLPAFFSKAVFAYLKKRKKRTLQNADVPPNIFRNNLISFMSRVSLAQNVKIIVIKICATDVRMQEKSPDIRVGVTAYNAIIDEIVLGYNNVIAVDPLGSDDAKLYVDGYHPGPDGNELVFKELKEKIQNG